MPGDQITFDWAGPPDDSEGRRGSATNPAAAEPGLLPRAVALRDRLRRLAERGVFIGTSSWKYPGWLGQVYHPERYLVRGRVSQKRFNDTCLEEYARVFPTVCGDFAFYNFPTPAFWERLFDRVPDGFRFGLKIPEDITVKRFADLPRYGKRAGRLNASFLGAGLLMDRLLLPLSPYRNRLGALIFQFGTFHHGPMTEPGVFAERLGGFLAQLPTDEFDFAVEVRNKAFLGGDGGGRSDYLDCLRMNNVAHCLNNWTRMPPVGEQLDLPGVVTAKHVTARFLLRPGRTYSEAVAAFSPYDRAKDPNPEARAAIQRLVDSTGGAAQRLFVFVNNRLEGNAIETIEAALGMQGSEGHAGRRPTQG